jgi:hypothetical protein
MAELAISKAFLSAYAKLPRNAQRAVDAVFGKFTQHTHAGLHLEKLSNARDPRIRTIRVGGFYRGVLLALGGESYLWSTVLPHDDAITYATSHRFAVNEQTGVLEVYDQTLLEEKLAAVPESAAASTARLFQHISNSDLHRLGIDARLLPLVRVISTYEELDALEGVLPHAQFEVLTGLAAGMSVDEVWLEVADRIAAGAIVNPDDLLAAAQRTP